MMGPTHAMIGAASWLGGLAALNAAGSAPIGVAIGLGGTALAALLALMPDIDTKNSLGSKLMGPVTETLSFGIRKLFGGHRKITHSLLGVALVAVPLFACVQSLHLIPWVAAAIVTGWVSHIAADMLTREGCPLLWPIDMHDYGLHLVTTGLDKKKGHHTSEWWIIHPLSIVAVIGFSILLIIGK